MGDKITQTATLHQPNLLELVFAISLISLGSSHTFFLPHLITEAASLFCSLRELENKLLISMTNYLLKYSVHKFHSGVFKILYYFSLFLYLNVGVTNHSKIDVWIL
jgi:hypothetical protein